MGDKVIDINKRRKLDQKEYALVLAFDEAPPGSSLDSEFVRGYEAGRIEAILKNKHREKEYNFTCHSSNREMMKRIAEYAGYELKIEQTKDPMWIFCYFSLK